MVTSGRNWVSDDQGRRRVRRRVGGVRRRVHRKKAVAATLYRRLHHRRTLPPLPPPPPRCHRHTATAAAKLPPPPCRRQAATSKLPPPLPPPPLRCRCHPATIATAVALTRQPSCCCRRHHRAELAPQRFRRRQATASATALPPRCQAAIATVAKQPSLPTRPPPFPHAVATRHCHQRHCAATAILPPSPRCRPRQAAAAKSVVC
jgi:hypothetical protein